MRAGHAGADQAGSAEGSNPAPASHTTACFLLWDTGILLNMWAHITDLGMPWHYERVDSVQTHPHSWHQHLKNVWAFNKYLKVQFNAEWWDSGK